MGWFLLSHVDGFIDDSSALHDVETSARTLWSGQAKQAMRNYIAARDHWLMYRLNNWRAPRWIRLWMICATRGGDGWLWYALGLAVLFFGGEQRFSAAGAAGCAAALGTVIFLLLKRKTGRRRPCAIAPHCWARLLPPDQFSFPSGHTITAFAVGVPLALHYPTLAGGLMFCATSIAISRIVLGMHFLSDVIAGALIGVLLGYGAYWVFLP
jgi:undecaprenyl-diphosphatase